jgi:hypothetical protein
MTTDREMERIVRSWLEPGLTTLTDDVLDPVLDQLPATPQRRPVWSLRRVRHVGSFAKFSLAAAALVVVTVIGFNLASRTGLPVVGAPTPSAPPSTSGDCRELNGPFSMTVGTIGVSATAPRGWFGVGSDGFYIQNQPCGMPGTGIVEWSVIDGVFADACAQDAVVETRTPAEVIAALAAQQGRQAIEPSATTVGGYPASRFQFAADFKNAGACRVGNLALWESAEGSGVPAIDTDHIVTVYVVDVDGTPVGIAATRCCTAEFPILAADLEDIVGSIRFETPPSGLTPIVPPSGAIEGGRYRWAASRGAVTLRLPEGWTTFSHTVGWCGIGCRMTLSHYLPGSAFEVRHIFADACHIYEPEAPRGSEPMGNDPIGPTVADLVEALENQAGTDATTSSFAGGQLVDIREAAGLDRMTCRTAPPGSLPVSHEGTGPWLTIWDDTDEDNSFAIEDGYRGEVYIFEHEGERFVFSATIREEASPADVERLHSIVESFEFSEP